MPATTTVGHSTPIGEYIALVLTIGIPVILWALARLLNSLGRLHSEQSTQSSSLAVLVERIGPVDGTLAGHDQRLRELENGHARLAGAVAAYRDTVQHALSTQGSPPP